MLPDFPELKRELHLMFLSFIEKRIRRYLGPLADIPKVRMFEGTGNIIERADGTTDETDMTRISEQFPVNRDEIEAFSLDRLISQLDFLARGIAEQTANNIYKAISDAAKKVGNEVNAGGKPVSPDLIFSMIETISMDFSDDGKPDLPQLHLSPEMLPKFQKAFEEIDQNPELSNRFKGIIQKKKDQFNAREINRRLVG